MWQAGSLLLILGSLVFLLRECRRLGGDRLSILVMLMIWLRLAVAALGEAAIDTRIAGLSLISLSTLASTGLAVLLIPTTLFRSARLTPFYVFVAFAVVSGLLNGATAELQEFVAMWAFFLTIALLLHRAYRLHGPRSVLRCLLAAYSLPMAMQALSLALRMPKLSPDGSLNYIGAYGHEVTFALVALSALWLAMIYPWERIRLGRIVAAAVLVGLLLANYRTIIIALLPLIFVFLKVHAGRNPLAILRQLVVPLVVLAVVLTVVAPQQVSERFGELRVLASDIGELTKRPEEYTAAEKNLLSARAYLWSLYIYGVIDADTPQFLVGHGPGARASDKGTHPHNEYLRALFEFGVLGAILFFAILLQQAAIALRGQPRPAAMITLAGFASLFLTASGTSIFNRPEGLILVALICATGWYLADQRAPVASRAAPLRQHARRVKAA